MSDATIQRLGTTNPLTHFFRQSDGETVGNRRTFTAGGSASGIGNLTVRLKSAIAHSGQGGISAGVDIRLPTGNKMEICFGTGATGVQPFAIASATFQNISPHANVSYQWNGSSVLAGNPGTGTSASFPDQVQYTVGADVAVNPHFTLAFDLLGRYVIDAERLTPQDFHALDGVSVYPNVTFRRDSFQMLNGAIGAKVNVFGRLLVDANLLFSLDSHGVRDRDHAADRIRTCF